MSQMVYKVSRIKFQLSGENLSDWPSHDNEEYAVEKFATNTAELADALGIHNT